MMWGSKDGWAARPPVRWFAVWCSCANRVGGIGSGGHSLCNLGFKLIANEAPRALNEREFIRQAALKQDANSVVTGYISCRNQSRVLRNAKLREVHGFYQDVQVFCGRVLNLSEFLTKVLDEDFLDARIAFDRLFADEFETLVLGGKNFRCDESACFQRLFDFRIHRELTKFAIELCAAFRALAEIA